MTKTLEKCPKCRWPHGFHVCIIDLRTPEGKRRAYRPVLKNRKGRAPVNRDYDDETFRENMRESARERWARTRDEQRRRHRLRDIDIVAHYKENWGQAALRQKFSVGPDTLRRVLNEAADRGEIVMRRRGYKNLVKPKQ